MTVPPATLPATLAVVVKGYPRISETFIARELWGLERQGFPLLIVSLRRPDDRLRHPVHDAIRAPVLYLPEYLYRAPGRVLRGHLLALARHGRRYGRAARAWLRDLRRDPTPNRVRRFGQAGVLAAELPAGTAHLHAHFLHTPGSVARYAALMMGLPYSLSAHAKDIWTRPGWELREKLRDARFAVTCTAENQAHLGRLAPGAPVHLVYHGIDRALFEPPTEVGSRRDGGDASDPVRLLAVGRFQPKKGFDVLLRALARVEGHVALTLCGYGPLERELRRLADRLGVAARVRWAGQLAQPAVRALYRQSDLFVLAPRVAADGDRDGLPNVVVEALSQGLPVVTTRTPAIAELVIDGVHGQLVPADDPGALADALSALVADPTRRARLGGAAVRRVSAEWDVEVGIARLCSLLRPVLARSDAAAPPAWRIRPVEQAEGARAGR